MKKIILVGVCACLTACSSAGTNTNNAAANSNAANSATQNKNRANDLPPPSPGTAVSNGQIQMGTTFPDWFPLYPGVDPKDVMAVATHGDPEFTAGSFSTADPPEKVLEFYENAFKSAGFKVKPTKVGDTPMTATNGGKNATVNASAKDGKTTAGFSFSEKK